MPEFEKIDVEAYIHKGAKEVQQGWSYVMQPDAYIWGVIKNGQTEWAANPDWRTATEARFFDGSVDILLWRDGNSWNGRKAIVAEHEGLEILWKPEEGTETAAGQNDQFVRIVSPQGHEWTLPKGNLRVRKVLEELDTGAVRVSATLMLGFEEE